MGTARAEDPMDQAIGLIHSAEAGPMENDVFFLTHGFIKDFKRKNSFCPKLH
ncbi:hypothetical protein SAMN05421687_104248 [Salimicrobium flavidum]|uniref:Uncharacterized protein n=1 Tax=Salimicrobium flavidum TaxID=570947 RepID=A0A1N7JA69_9BACI|nr:hypothetical protein SAMN05421687_104248 [Salimicrobium flavidum]